MPEFQAAQLDRALAARDRRKSPFLKGASDFRRFC
jgi:hypothetical protein